MKIQGLTAHDRSATKPFHRPIFVAVLRGRHLVDGRDIGGDGTWKVPATLVGQTFGLLAWNGPLDVGNRFGSIVTDSRLVWDLSGLYRVGFLPATADGGVGTTFFLGGGSGLSCFFRVEVNF